MSTAAAHTQLPQGAIPDITGYWKGAVLHNNKTWNIAVTFKKEDNTTKAYVDFLDLQAYHREFSVVQNKDSFHLKRAQPGGKFLIFDGIIANKKLTGRWSGIGIENAAFTLQQTKPILIQEEEISFKNGEAKLSGTLLRPIGNGPFALIIFMHGGAAEDRSVYYAAAMKFIQKGIAAFIYDKRGVGKSTGGDWAQDGLTALANDAVAAIGVLKSRTDIDSKNIAVFGHSEGGWTAPLAATISKDIAYVIVSGASSISASEQTVYHRSNVMIQDGFDKITVQKGTELWKQLYTAAKLCATDTTEALRIKQILNDSIEAVHKESWFSSAALPYPYPTDCPSEGVMELLFKDPLPVWKKIKVPVLAIWGDKDIVIPFKKSLADIKTALEKSGNKKGSFVIIPDVNHSIVYENTKSKEWDFPREAPGYFERMANWLNQQIKRK